MNFYQLGFKYLQRKKSKMILLLTILILVNSAILSTGMILRATDQSKQNIQEKTNSKIIAEITNQNRPITSNEINRINALDSVASINRIGRQAVYPMNFAPVTASPSLKEENMKIAFLSYDDLEKDSPFSEMQYRLSSGNYIKNSEKGAVINLNLANQNGLENGDMIELGNQDHAVSVQIIGIFKSSANAENSQPETTAAIDRIENQVFVDNETYSDLFQNPVFDKICIYIKNPEHLNLAAEAIQSILKTDVEIRTSDTLYQQLSAPLEQIRKAAGLMLSATLLTGTIVISLLLCMWSRTRQKEIAVLMSIGKKKRAIFLQMLFEISVIFILSVLIAALLGSFLAKFLQTMIPSIDTVSLEVFMQPQDLILLLILGTVVLLAALCCSVLPVIKTNP